MESETLAEITNIFNLIDIENNPDSEKYEQYWYKPYKYKAQPKLRRIFPKPIDFEKYVQENCDHKIKILDRLTFHEIKRPIIIFFHHFREKCAYYTKWLDRMYQLALKYGDEIEFIAADMIDIDIIKSEWNPLNFFRPYIRPGDESPNTFAIDAKKKIHQHYNAYRNEENMIELLLNGKLYHSQPIPQNDDTKLVKICVHDNYEDLIQKSTEDILLILALTRYLESDPNYEKVALQLKDYNVDIVYMDAEENYIPFEYNVNCYPTILFIPHNDKNNFIYFDDNRTEENLVAFLKELVGQPENLKLKQKEQQKKCFSNQKSLVVPDNFEMDVINLPQYLEVNFKNFIKVLDRKALEKLKTWALVIIYMNFQGGCLAHHIQWLDKIYQVARSFPIEYLVADYKDIDIINTKWKRSDFITSVNPKDEIPKVFGIDRLKYTYEFSDFKTVPSLLYFSWSLSKLDFYYSQCYPRNQDEQLVKTCVADSFNIFLKQSKKYIFITFYDPDHKEVEKLLNILEEIAKGIKERDLYLEVVKFNVKENYVDLEYAYHTYPVHYFISSHNRKKNIRYVDNDLNKENMLKFITKNIQK